MNSVINKRVIDEARYIIKTKDTIRQVAKVFNVSKSTVHKDMQKRLMYINVNLYNKVSIILDYHKQIRHIRGGEATKIKYQK